MPQPVRIALLLFVAAAIATLVLMAFIKAFRRSHDPVKLAVIWGITLFLAGMIGWFAYGSQDSMAAVLVVLFCVPVGIILAIIWAPRVASLLISPLTSALDGGQEEIEPAPLYSIAEGQRRRGNAREAMYSVREQLKKFPTDFTGQMLLAGIQAEDLNDLPGAGLTIQRLCEQPGHSPANLAYALGTLADWHLKLSQDPEAALEAFEKIISLLPETEFARTAANRIAHLGNRSVLLQPHEAESIHLKPGVEYLGLLKDQSHLLPKEKPADVEAQELVRHLEKHPHDYESRERLAVLYAKSYSRMDLAQEQLEQLISLPGESPKHVVRWLNLLADLQIESSQRLDEAERTLRRILELFPNQSYAALAEQRLDSLKLELKRFEQTGVVKFPQTRQ